MNEGPTVAPFTYVKIPADERTPLEQHKFTGSSDEELRTSLARYFQSNSGLSVGQQKEYKEHMVQQIAENARKQQQQQGGGAGGAAVVPAGAQAPSDGGLPPGFDPSMLDDMTHTFEIVPVVMPQRNNGFIGTSLYIDEVGRFKELPINTRASAIAQKDIRGDAFLLSNKDDPRADDWCRMDTTIETCQHLMTNPPQGGALDTSNQAAMNAAAMARERDAMAVNGEALRECSTLKEDGNKLVGKSNFTEAVDKYGEVVKKLHGASPDELTSEEKGECRSLLAACFSNRALCNLKLSRFGAAVEDAKASLAIDDTNGKVWYRLAQGLLGLQDYDYAEQAGIRAAEVSAGNDASVDAAKVLIDDVRRQRTAFKERERQKFSKMF